MPNLKYNGHILPAAPSYNDVTYDKAYITGDPDANLYYFIVVGGDAELIYESSEYPAGSGAILWNSASIGMVWVLGADGWGEPSEDSDITADGYYVVRPDWCEPIWANFDILDKDGSIYLAASEPKKLFNLQSFLDFFALGLSGKPLPLAVAVRKPVAYLYNGVRLPELPNPGDYRYAYISEDGANPGKYLLTYITCPIKYFVSGGTNVMATETSARFAEYRCADGKTWEFVREQTASGYWLNYAAKGNDWTNHDIFDGEGNLYLPASTPVPVYE